MAELLNKVVVVTGANSGIGEATVVAFADAGAQVYGTARTDETLAEARRRHPKVRWVKLDVRDAHAARSAVEAVIKEAGHLDVLVNNAGVARLLPLQATSPEELALQFETNVYGLTYVTQAALPALQNARGAIVNIGSVSGRKPQQLGSIYAASKAAVEALTRSWAYELAPLVRVNAISPGPVKTPIVGKLGLPPQVAAGLAEALPKSLPLQRLGEPAEVARWILRLADLNATWLTGQILSVDGGMSVS